MILPNQAVYKNCGSCASGGGGGEIEGAKVPAVISISGLEGKQRPPAELAGCCTIYYRLQRGGF